MKRICLIFTFIFTFLMTSCSLGELIDTINETKYCITYHLRNGEEDFIETVSKDSTYEFKDDIVRENCTFVGWYYDEFLQTECPESIDVNENIEVYAKWEVNENYYTTLLSNNVKNGVFTYYEMAPTSIVSYSLIQGTAFAFDEDDNYYYCMTNNHVTAANDNKKYIILNDGSTYRNYYESSFPANLFEKKYEIEEVYADANYDLSIFKIGKSSDFTIDVLRFSTETLLVDDIVLSYGSPTGHTNTLTAGTYIGNKKVNLTDEETNVRFDALIHTSEIDNGSSGGPLFNEAGEVVAVNYAGGSTKAEGEFVWGAAIPLDKIKEFIEESNYLNM